MTEITVRLLRESEWEQYRAIRLRALAEAPEAFVATADEEAAFDESLWRDRMVRSARFVAYTGQDAIGVISLRTTPPSETGDELDEQIRDGAEVFGLWVAPEARGRGVPKMLVDAAADRAHDNGRKHLVYWVGTDNGPAVGFASGYGFRPTDTRRPARAGSDENAIEAAMLFPVKEWTDAHLMADL